MIATSGPPIVTPAASRTMVGSPFHSRETCLYGFVT